MTQMNGKTPGRTTLEDFVKLIQMSHNFGQSLDTGNTVKTEEIHDPEGIYDRLNFDEEGWSDVISTNVLTKNFFKIGDTVRWNRKKEMKIHDLGQVAVLLREQLAVQMKERVVEPAAPVDDGKQNYYALGGDFEVIFLGRYPTMDRENYMKVFQEIHQRFTNTAFQPLMVVSEAAMLSLIESASKIIAEVNE